MDRFGSQEILINEEGGHTVSNTETDEMQIEEAEDDPVMSLVRQQQLKIAKLQGQILRNKQQLLSQQSSSQTRPPAKTSPKRITFKVLNEGEDLGEGFDQIYEGNRS